MVSAGTEKGAWNGRKGVRGASLFYGWGEGRKETWKELRKRGEARERKIGRRNRRDQVSAKKVGRDTDWKMKMRKGREREINCEIRIWKTEGGKRKDGGKGEGRETKEGHERGMTREI